MTETFTTILNSTNAFEMKEQGSIENMGADETNFYNSIRADLDLIEMGPKASTIQNILNHSKNLR
jgi:hypothetical protein